MAQTQWNREHSNHWDRLEQDTDWGIVLHWYGDNTSFDRTIEGYLRGFDELRQVDDYITRTSAHFLVGGGLLTPSPGSDRDAMPILQTQKADADGTPFVASHLKPLDYQLHQERGQYFVRALYELGYQQPTIHSILQDWFDGQRVDANMRSLAIELTGCDFNTPEHSPTNQQTANVVGLVWALMQYYGIRASNILGHHEIQIDKPDPGKRFMALVRCLLGAKAMTENNPVMNKLVFGQHLGSEQDTSLAARIYLQWVRDYLVKVSRPSQVYAWEAESGYWFLADGIMGEALPTASGFLHPLPDSSTSPEHSFCYPSNHEGVDLYIKDSSRSKPLPIKLITDGVCLYAGDAHGDHPGKQAIFRHRQRDGAEILSIYGNLSRLQDLREGSIYPPGYPIGMIRCNLSGTKILHFAIAYRTAWERSLNSNPDAPMNANSVWVQENYLDPMKYLNQHIAPDSSTRWELPTYQPH
jgi:hypothetical protein